MNTLVTGASGYIATQLINHLRARYYPVIPITRRLSSTGRSCGIPCDYFSEDELFSCFKNVETVFHLAGPAHELTKVTDPPSYYYKNIVQLGVNVAKACISSRVRRLVFISTIGVYGLTADSPVHELSQLNPHNSYALAKLVCENLVSDICASASVELVVLRIPLVYGIGAPGNLNSLLRLLVRLPILPFKGFTGERHFIYINSLIEALLISASRQVEPMTYNLSDCQPISLARISNIVSEFTCAYCTCQSSFFSNCIKCASLLLRNATIHKKLASPLQINNSRFCDNSNWNPFFEPDPVIRDIVAAILNS